MATATPLHATSRTPGGAVDDRRAYLVGLALVAGAGLVWSIGHLTFRMVESDDPWTHMAYRWFLVIPIMLAAVTARHGHATDRAIVEGGVPVFVTGLLLAGSSITFVLAISFTAIGNVLFFIAAAPIFAAVLGRVFLGEPVRPATVIAFPFVLGGMAIMVGGSLAGGSLLGNVLGFACSLMYAAFSVTIRMRKQADTRPATIYASLVTCALGLVLMGPGAISLADVFWLTAGGVWQLALGFWLFTMGAKHVPAVQLLLLGMIETVCAPVWLWLAFGEAPAQSALIGGAVILIAVVAQALAGVRRKPLGVKPR